MYLFNVVGVNEIMEEQVARGREYYSREGIEAILEFLGFNEDTDTEGEEFDLIAWNGTFTEYEDFDKLAKDNGFHDYIDFDGIENGEDLEYLLVYSKGGIEYTLYEVENELERYLTILTTASGSLITVA